MKNENQIQDSTIEQQHSQEHRNAGVQSLPDGVEVVNGKLIDRKSGGDILSLTDAMAKLALDEYREMQRKREEKIVPYDPKLEEYFNDVMSGPKLELTYEEAKKQFYLIWRTNLGREPVINEKDKWIIQNFVKWLINDSDGL